MVDDFKKKYGEDPHKYISNKYTSTPLNSVFVSGSSKTQDPNSEYYRKDLPEPVRKELDRYMKEGERVIVGDAPGIDRQVQNYLKEKNYDNVKVFGPGTELRYLADKGWKSMTVDDPDNEPGSPQWLAKKDEYMSQLANKAMAVVLDEGSKATKRNIKRYLSEGIDDVSVYELNKSSSKLDRWLDDNGKKTIAETIDDLDMSENLKKYNSKEANRPQLAQRAQMLSRADYTQAEIAKKLGVSASYVNDLLNSK